MSFIIIRNDITKVTADVIVNSANPNPVYAPGTDAAIYNAAGKRQLLAERRKIGYLNRGEAVATPAFNLPAKYIIHTVGPVWSGGNQGEFEQLRSCYNKSLLLARQLGCKSIAFPLISTGVYGFPKDKALDIALGTIRDFLENEEMDITLVVFDKKAFDLSNKFYEEVKQFIDDNYVEDVEKRISARYDESIDNRSRRLFLRPSRLEEKYSSNIPSPQEFGDRRAEPEEYDYSLNSYDAQETSVHSFEIQKEKSVSISKNKRSLNDLINQVDETFQEKLFRIIDEKEMTDTEVYKKAYVDRKLFSKIRCNPYYNPKKQTAISLALALELNLDETLDLIGRAGYALSPSNIADLILRFCIENKMYDIIEINALLFQYDQKCLS